jgi:hypothetical protein
VAARDVVGDGMNCKSVKTRLDDLVAQRLDRDLLLRYSEKLGRPYTAERVGA